MDSVLTIEGAGTGFHAQLRGSGACIVFLHGFAGDLHTWDGVWAELGESLPALRYDLRGFGRTPAGDDKPYSHADDLLAVVEGAGIEQADLVGVSMGGSIALNFALDHPGRVRNLVLVSPGLVAWEWSEEWLSRWRPLINLAVAGKLAEARRLWWQHPLFATTRDSEGGGGTAAGDQAFCGDPVDQGQPSAHAARRGAAISPRGAHPVNDRRAGPG